MTTLDEINDSVDSWVGEHLDENFDFRPYQREVIVKILDNIVNDKMETNIIEAPTGSGKSLICIITAGVLSEYYKTGSYILCSDLYLWDQYYGAIIKNKLKFGYLKGAKNNYICSENNATDITTGSLCKLHNKSYNQFIKIGAGPANGFECAESCEYVLAKRHAMKMNVTLMTYQLWLKYMNFTDGTTFSQKPVIFCDECHNIPNIIQMFCQPTINDSYDFKDIINVFKYGIEHNLTTDEYLPYTNCNKNDGSDLDDTLNNNIEIKYAFNTNTIEKDLRTHFDVMYKSVYTDIDNILEHYNKFKEIVQSAAVIADLMEADIAKRKEKGSDDDDIDDDMPIKGVFEKTSKKKSKTDLTVSSLYVKSGERVKDLLTSMDFFINGVLGKEKEYFVKNENENSLDHHKTISFASSKEDNIINKFLMSNAKYKVMLSATVGNKTSFDENIGVRLTKTGVSEMTRIPSTFDFSKSPIITIGRDVDNFYDQSVIELVNKFAMTRNVIDQNFPNMVDAIIKIISSNKHQHERGFIHTGSYKNAINLYNKLPNSLKGRVLLYTNSKDKNEIIDKYLNSDNCIIAGPSLTEGIDFPDDGCRFQIIMKVPYPNLGDKLVDSKRRMFTGWYESETSNTIIQAVGRGNRTPDDYSITYILDSGFYPLYKKTINQYAPEFQNRIRLLNNI